MSQKADKQLLQQQKSNVIRDRKGRPFFINEKTQETYQLLAGEEKAIYFYDGRTLFSILPIMLTELINRKWIFYALLLSLVIHVGFEVYFQITLKKLTKTNKMPQEVWDRYHSEEVLKAKRSDLILKILLGVTIAMLVITNPYAFNYIGKTDLTRNLANFVITFVIIFGLTYIGDYFKVQKRIKKLK